LGRLKGKNIRISLDEWNYWHRPYVSEYGGARLAVTTLQRPPVGVATGLHEMIRSSDMIFMANYAQTVNVIGCIKTTKTEAAFATTGLTLKLYRNHFGSIPVTVSGNVKPLDVVAAWTEDRKAVTVAVVNPTAHTYEIALDVKDAQLTGGGQRRQISGPDAMAYNEPGKEPKVVIEEKSFSGTLDKLSVPPLSICLYKLRAR